MAARDPNEAQYSPAVRCMFHRYKASRHNLTLRQFMRMGVVGRMTSCKKLAPMIIRVKNPSGLVNFPVDAEDDQWYPKLCNEVAEVMGKTHRVDLAVDDRPLSQLKLGELMALSKRPRRVVVVHQENYPLHAIQIKRVSKPRWLPKHHVKGMQRYDVHTRALMMNMTRELARRIYDQLFATERSRSARVSYQRLYQILTSVMCSDDLYVDTPTAKDDRARSGRAYILFFKGHGIRNVPKRQDAVLKKLVRALNKHQYHRKRVGVAIKRSNVRVPENEDALREQPGWTKMSDQQRDVQRLLTKVGVGHMLLAKASASEPGAAPALCYGIKGMGPEMEPPQRAYASDSDGETSSDSDEGEDAHGMTMINIGRRYHGAMVWHSEGPKIAKGHLDRAFITSAIPDSEPIARKYHGAASVTVVKGGAREDGVNSGHGRAFIAAPVDGEDEEEWAGSEEEKRELESLWDASDVVQEVGALAGGSDSDSDYEPLSMEDGDESALEVGEAVDSGDDMQLLADSDDEAREIGEAVRSDDEYESMEEEDARDVSFADTDGEEEVMTMLKDTAQRVSAGIMSDDEDTAFFTSVMTAGQEVDDEFEDEDDEFADGGDDDDAGMEAAFSRLEKARRRDTYANYDMDEDDEDGEEEEEEEAPPPEPMFDFTKDEGGDGLVMSEMSVVGAAVFGSAPSANWKDSCDHILPEYPDPSAAQRVDVTTGVINGGLKDAVVAGHDAGYKMRLYVPTNAAWKAYQDATGFGPEACSARARWSVPFVRRAGDGSAVGRVLKGFRYVADRKVKQKDGSSVYELPLVPDMASAAMMGALRRELESKREACSASGLRKKIDAYTQSTLQSALVDIGARVINTDALYADLTSSSYDEGDPRAGAASFMSVYEFLAYSGQIDTAGGRLVFAMSNAAWEERYAKFVKALLQRSQWAKKLCGLIANHVARVNPESDAFLVRKGRQYLVKTDASPARYVLFDSSKVRGRKKDALKFVSYDVESSFSHPALATTSVIVSGAPYTVFLAVSEEDAKQIYNFPGQVTAA